MFRFKSFFTKMLFTNITIILVVIFVLIGTLTLGIRSFYIDSTVSNMQKTSEKISELFESVYYSNDSAQYLKNTIKLLSDFENLSISIYDKYGSEYFSVDSYNDSLSVNKELIQKNQRELQMRNDDGFGWTSRNQSNLYSTPVLSVRFPLLVENDIKGYGYIHNKLDSYENTLRLIYKRILLCFVISIVLVFIVTYLSYKNTIKTIKNINVAAGAFARGNFKNRVNVIGCDEISTLAVTYNSMADELEKYEITRQSFVGNVSHELRSPLTSIQGFVQGMLDGTIDSNEAPQYLEVVLNESKRMSLLIQDLLDLTKIESGQFPLEMTKYDICEEIRKTLINFITKIENKEIVLTADIPDNQKIVLADRSRIAQVLTNLLDNAVKFCNPNGSIKVWTYDADGRIHVNISNTGAYIPEEDIPYVFDRFFKVDKSHTKKSPGTGIGLSIVKSIVLQHGEKIWVSSRKGTGTVFTFTLRLTDEVDINDRNKNR